jgi:putative endonuclease
MFFVYILQSEISGKYYIGSTGDLNDRLQRHNHGRSKATKSGIPWKLVCFETFENRADAMKREMQIKSWKSHLEIDKLVLRNNDPNNDLT